MLSLSCLLAVALTTQVVPPGEGLGFASEVVAPDQLGMGRSALGGCQNGVCPQPGFTIQPEYNTGYSSSYTRYNEASCNASRRAALLQKYEQRSRNLAAKKQYEENLQAYHIDRKNRRLDMLEQMAALKERENDLRNRGILPGNNATQAKFVNR